MKGKVAAALKRGERMRRSRARNGRSLEELVAAAGTIGRARGLELRPEALGAKVAKALKQVRRTA
jgi:hypothetical protein